MDTKAQCYSIPDSILDGIFSTEEMLRWRRETEEENRRHKKRCLSSFHQSYIIEIEPTQFITRDTQEISTKVWNHRRTEFEKYLGQARLRKGLLFFLTKCSYFPFLFMFSMAFLSLSLTSLPCVVISLSISMVISTFHLAYVAQSRTSAGLENSLFCWSRKLLLPLV